MKPIFFAYLICVTFGCVFSIGCNKSERLGETTYHSNEIKKPIFITWSLDTLKTDSESYNPIVYNITLTKDSLVFYVDELSYTLFYCAPLRDGDKRILANILSGVNPREYSEFSKFTPNCTVRYDAEYLPDSISNQIVNFALSISPFLPERNLETWRGIPKNNSKYTRMDSISWEHLTIRKYPWLRIMHDVWSDGHAKFYDQRIEPELGRPKVISKHELILSQEELDSITKLIWSCNPEGFFCLIDSITTDLDSLTICIDGREIFRSYALESDIPKQYLQLRSIGDKHLSLK